MEALIPLLILGAVVLLPLLWFIGNYNALVRLRNHCKESWSDIDTELKRRHDLIPNLVETVKGYAKHEESLFNSIAEARTQAIAEHASAGAQAEDENRLTRRLGRLFALAEAYPDIKADRHFAELQDELANTENRIQSARRYYNANVRDLANRIEMFPSSIVASMFGFVKFDYFEIDPLETATPKV